MRQVIAGLGVGTVGIALIVDRLSGHGSVSAYIGGGLVIVGLSFLFTGTRQMRFGGKDQKRR